MNAEWKNEILDEKFRSKYSVLENSDIYIQKGHRIENSVWNESEFAGRKEIEFTTSWCEHLFVEKEMERIFRMAKLDSEWFCIDLGCSDGRFVKFLIKLGVKRIVAINFELLPLKVLEDNLTMEEKQKVLLMCGDFLSHPFKQNTFDLTIAWGFWSATKNFILSQNLTLDITKKGGYLLNAEPVLEQHVMYSLIRGDISEFLTTLKNKSRPVSWDNKSKRYDIKTEKEILSLMRSKRFQIEDQFGVSSLYSYIFGGIAQDKNWSVEQKEKAYESIKDAAELLHAYRQVAFFSKKVE